MEGLKFFLRKSPLCVTALHFQIVVEDINQNQKFIFHISNLMFFYLSLLKILSIFREAETNKIGDKLGDCDTYFWEMSSCEEVVLYIKNDGKVEYRSKFDYFQFNELLYAISLSIVPSLSLDNSEAEFFVFLLESEIEDFVNLKSIINFRNFLSKSPFQNNTLRLYCVFNFYLDIIFINWRLKKFINHELLPNSLKPLLK